MPKPISKCFGLPSFTASWAASDPPLELDELEELEEPDPDELEELEEPELDELDPDELEPEVLEEVVLLESPSCPPQATSIREALSIVASPIR